MTSWFKVVTFAGNKSGISANAIILYPNDVYNTFVLQELRMSVRIQWFGE